MAAEVAAAVVVAATVAAAVVVAVVAVALGVAVVAVALGVAVVYPWHTMDSCTTAPATGCPWLSPSWQGARRSLRGGGRTPGTSR